MSNKDEYLTMQLQILKPDRLYLIEIVRKISPKSHTEDFFKIIDSECFYHCVMNRVLNSTGTEKFEKILSNFGIYP